MNLIKLRHASLTALLFAPLALACNDDGSGSSAGDGATGGTAETDGSGPEAGESNGDGDGDTGDGDGDTGDGDGDTGDGDGDTGDGDGDTGDGDGDTGDGDGDTGDGDGDTGDGDGDGDACAPDDAHGEGMCDQFFGWAWDGVECVGVSGCNCIGTDCDTIPIEMADCDAAHADCGMPGGCAGLEFAACANNISCMPIYGQPVMDSNQGECLGMSEFVDCDDAMICGDVLSWGCDINATPTLFSTTCLAPGYMPCDGPDVPECP